jgi:seryl-tRNA synthetase
MLDIKWIRDNPKALVEALAKRSWSADEAQSTVDDLIAKDEARREHVTELQTKQERRNAASKEIGNAMRSGDAALADKLKAEVGDIKTFIQNGEARERELDKALNDALAVLPNVPLDDVPVGKDEHDNVVKHLVGKVPTRPNWVREHFEIGEALGMMDFERAAKLSGSRFTVLRSGLARMERAIGQFMLDLHTNEHGYAEINPPLLVRNDVMFGTGQLPKFEDDAYKIADDDLYLIPTAEVPVTNLYRDETLDAAMLPKGFCAYTPCFRREAGSAGKDTRGILRMHQFDKVELVRYCAPEDSDAQLELLLGHSEKMLQRLGIPYRVKLLAAGDTGFASAKTYDLEAWAPGVGSWLEVSSCSSFSDFQARRANIRYKPSKTAKPRHVHTLNGSGLAFPRTIACILEHHQQADGSVLVPDALRTYLGTDRLG